MGVLKHIYYEKNTIQEDKTTKFTETLKEDIANKNQKNKGELKNYICFIIFRMCFSY